MRCVLPVIWIFLCLSGAVLADDWTILTGRVMDESTGQPLTAIVQIPDLKLSQGTDAEGRYLFRIPLTKQTPSTVSVTVSAQGFESETQTISLVPATVTLNFSLSLNFHEQISVYGPELQPEEPTEPEPTTGLPPSITTEIGDSGLEGILEERHPMTRTFRFRL